MSTGTLVPFKTFEKVTREPLNSKQFVPNKYIINELAIKVLCASERYISVNFKIMVEKG